MIDPATMLVLGIAALTIGAVLLMTGSLAYCTYTPYLIPAGLCIVVGAALIVWSLLNGATLDQAEQTVTALLQPPWEAP